MTAPPAHVNGKQLRLSWSRLRSHEECRAKGALQAAGHRSPAADVRPYFHGTVVDLAMRRWLGMEKPPSGWMPKHIDEILDEAEVTAKETGDGIVKWKSTTDKDEMRVFCRELVVLLENILAEVALPFEWEPAVRFAVPIEIPYLDGSLRQIQLVGEMDLLVKRPDGRVVYDLKATRDDHYWRKVEGQMQFYDICMWGLTGEFPVGSALIQPMCQQQVLPFCFGDESRRQMFTRICTVAMDIFRGDLAPKDNSQGCAYCAVRHACPRYKTPAGGGRVTLGR